MLVTTVQPDTNVVTIEFSGTLEAAEMISCRAALEQAYKEHGKLRLVARYGDIDMAKIEPKAMWEDLKNIPLIRHVERCAIVAHQEWVRRISDLAAHVLPCEIKTFDLDEYAAAQDWITH